MVDRSQRPRTGRSAKALLLTMLGEFALPDDGTIWTSAVIDGLGLVGVNEANARQAATRLADDGLLVAERHGRSTQWSLTAAGRALLSSGAERIYSFGTANHEWNGEWLLVSATVPEDARAKRHHLRTRLGFLGCGFVHPGLAVTPHTEREHAVRRVISELDLDPPAMVFRGAASTPDREIIGRAWDLDSLAQSYEHFIDAFARRRPSTPDARFAATLELVHEWRRFPFIDPEIPASLLPPRWPGLRAKSLFDDRRRRWSADEWRSKAMAAPALLT